MCYNRIVPESPTVASAEENRRAFEQARLRIARMRVEGGPGLRRVLQEQMEIAARTLGVERVGVWLFVNERRALRCFELYETASGQHSEGALLQAADFPSYFRALHERTSVPADDARADPNTAELRRAYLEPLGILSMLDAPIFRNGQVIGVVCHEETGEQREWTTEERDFASAMADGVALRIENAARLEAESRLLAHESHLAEFSKMEALGRLAAGVAHDFNNMLSVVLAHAGRPRACPRRRRASPNRRTRSRRPRGAAPSSPRSCSPSGASAPTSRACSTWAARWSRSRACSRPRSASSTRCGSRAPDRPAAC